MWQLYLIRCRDNSLYTGVTNDLARRLREHAAEGAACAKYLRGKGPFTLVFTCVVGARAEALRMERRIKKLPKSDKERLVTGQIALADVV
jgi:putative endonuclease